MDLKNHTLDHQLIHGQLKSKTLDTIRKLEGQVGAYPILSPLLQFFLKIADNNYDAVRTLVVQSYKFASPAMVICRSTSELVFTVCLILSNVEQNLPLYLKAGWREQFEEFERYRDDEMFKEEMEWLKNYEMYLEFHAATIGVTTEEKVDPTKIKYFPTPTQILSPRYPYSKDLDPHTLNFLQAFDEGYYSGLLSKLSHYSESGMAWQVSPLFPGYPKTQQDLIVSQPVAISMLILIALLSEISLYFGFDDRAKLKELWTYLALTIPLHQRLYEAKYRLVL
ncbi:MAG: hypothetical protein K6T83_13900 [Alicyclobacillus sp.]|nr:hypothetical protein [Alicyclobacillus sp.]